MYRELRKPPHPADQNYSIKLEEVDPAATTERVKHRSIHGIGWVLSLPQFID
jgi:hypothetical protein